MRLYTSIFAFIFITGMLFSLVRYIPLRGDFFKTELSKKMCEQENDEAGGDTEKSDPDPDTDSDTDDLFASHNALDVTNYTIQIHTSSHTELNYFCSYVSKTTPPPKF